MGGAGISKYNQHAAIHPHTYSRCRAQEKEIISDYTVKCPHLLKVYILYGCRALKAITCSHKLQATALHDTSVTMLLLPLIMLVCIV